MRWRIWNVDICLTENSQKKKQQWLNAFYFKYSLILLFWILRGNKTFFRIVGVWNSQQKMTQGQIQMKWFWVQNDGEFKRIEFELAGSNWSSTKISNSLLALHELKITTECLIMSTSLASYHQFQRCYSCKGILLRPTQYGHDISDIIFRGWREQIKRDV